MTDREKAIVMAYTGYAMLTGDKLGLYYSYIQEKVGRPVMTHELAEKPMQETIHVLSKPDFVELCRTNDEPRVMTLEEVKEYGGVCWLEWFADEFLGIILCDDAIIQKDTFCDTSVGVATDDGIDFWALGDYGKKWRCWTSRPTDEQREGAKWQSSQK